MEIQKYLYQKKNHHFKLLFPGFTLVILVQQMRADSAWDTFTSYRIQRARLTGGGVPLTDFKLETPKLLSFTQHSPVGGQEAQPVQGPAPKCRLRCLHRREARFCFPQPGLN